MAQRQVIQIGCLHLGFGDGIIGRICHSGVAVEHADGVFLPAVCPEILQQRRAVHTLKACAVNTGIQLRNGHGLHLGGAENIHILRPQLPKPGAAYTVIIVVAGGNHHRHFHRFQHVKQVLIGGRGIRPVKYIACDKHQIALFCLDNFKHLTGDGGQRLTQALTVALHRGI